MITHSNVGDMADGLMPGGLRYFHASCLISLNLTGAPNDLQTVCPRISNMAPAQISIINGDLVTTK